MTKEQAVNLYQTLNQMGHLTGVKFTYAVAKNLSVLKPEVEAVQKILEYSEEYKKYDEERRELLAGLAEKDSKGKPVITDKGEYKFKDDKDYKKAQSELKKLEKKHQKAVDERKKQLEEAEELLKKDTDVKLHKVNLDDVPEEISAKEMNSIVSIIED